MRTSAVIADGVAAAAGVKLVRHLEVIDMSARWEHFPHAADMGIRGLGSTEAEAFEQAALAMTAVVADPATVIPREEVSVQCEAPDHELLLAEWLNALIYEMATRRMLFSRFSVRLDGTQLHARARGEPVDPARHHPAVEIKGATYTALSVARQQDEWVAQTVVDV
jgi:protein archease